MSSFFNTKLIMKNIALNRRATYEYTILERYEAGLALRGSEVKSLRGGSINLAEAFVGPQENELILWNTTIPLFHSQSAFQHEPKRPRKLLMRRREINRLIGSVARKGLSIVPLRLYLTKRGWFKLEIGLGQGKKLVDKRAAIKERDWNRQKQRRNFDD
jgi:SsrA-binding protein